MTMEVILIERSTYEELHPRLTPAPYQGTSNVSQMKAMAGRGTDKRLGEWLDNQDACQILNVSPRTLQTLRQNGTLAYSQIEHKTRITGTVLLIIFRYAKQNGNANETSVL
jgi:hypothetical protein